MQPGIGHVGRAWIEGPTGPFGYGRVVPLERDGEHGSTSAAARSMEMSYRHAWKLVDLDESPKPQSGSQHEYRGRGGGGAHLQRRANGLSRPSVVMGEISMIFTAARWRCGSD